VVLTDTCTRARWLLAVVSLTLLCASGTYLSTCLAVSASQTTLYFLANNVSHKFDDLEADPHVNVSFYGEIYISVDSSHY
jgi:general stress protein 26